MGIVHYTSTASVLTLLTDIPAHDKFSVHVQYSVYTNACMCILSGCIFLYILHATCVCAFRFLAIVCTYVCLVVPKQE